MEVEDAHKEEMDQEDLPAVFLESARRKQRQGKENQQSFSPDRKAMLAYLELNRMAKELLWSVVEEELDKLTTVLLLSKRGLKVSARSLV